MERIFIQTFGCTHNQADSELMMGLLVQAGYEEAFSAQEADLVIINSCTVKNGAEAKMFTAMNAAATQLKKPTIITGCVPQGQPSLLTEVLKNTSIVGVTQYDKIAYAVEKTLQGETIHLLQRNPEESPLNKPKVRRNPIVEIVPINSGCLGSCTYCKTLHSRGRLRSYPKEDIIRQIKRAVEEGVKEVWLTSEDTGAWGKDIGLRLPDLLQEVIRVSGDFKVRLGMGNPNHILGFLDELVSIMKHQKMFKFLHLPAQSGNNRILQLMKREYTAEEYKTIATRFRQEIPAITIATDIIVGFPTETDEEFQDSLRLIHDTRPSVLNISRFWDRPGTAAAMMPQLDPTLVKERSKCVTELFNSIARQQNNGWIKWEGNIIIDERGKNGSFVGRNDAYKPIIVHGDYHIGDTISVKVQETTTYDLRAIEALCPEININARCRKPII
ncbi:tRNA (N(6)-L-threonylcarbamoyladenosine(37)-C(2))-methylthiotransferase [Candidatus Woesearchaeota archaeon]|nr:tRNA (N(6)-L-threonylcarbamoyladenosine(37)-C(2))-methylthiotransferase [Candidatus Woesearchaeota archaeon]